MTIFFDADDTLWNTERRYFEKQQEIALYCATQYELNYDEILTSIVAGCNEYMSGPLSRSIFPETCVKICAKLIYNLTSYDIIVIYRICESVFNYTPKLKENTIETLIELGRMGHSCVILTVGDENMQSAKIFKSKVYQYISDAIITPIKSVEFYAGIKAKFPQNKYIMVGDRFDNDIENSVAVGFYGIWLHEQNKTHSKYIYEISDIKYLPKVVKEIG